MLAPVTSVLSLYVKLFRGACGSKYIVRLFVCVVKKSSSFAELVDLNQIKQVLEYGMLSRQALSRSLWI